MSKPNSIKIDEVEYVRADMAHEPVTGCRAVVVVDRGWIFAGDVKRENGRIKISRAIHIFKWDSIGFAKMVEMEKADLRPIANIDLPQEAEIFCIPVHDKWGMK